MNRVRHRLMALAVLPFLLALAVDLTLYALLRDRLPDPLASHFAANGSSDGTQSRGSTVLFVCVLHLGLGALWAALMAAGEPAVRRLRWLNAAGYAVAGLVGYLLAATLLANVDATDPTRVRLPLWQLAVGVGVAALAAALGRLLPVPLPPPGSAPSSGPSSVRDAAPGGAPRLDLAEGEVAGWMRRAPSRVLLGCGAVLLVAGSVLLYAGGWSHAVGALFGAVVCLAFSCPYVTVDRRGLTARPTVLPWPRIRIPLSDVTRAVSREIKVTAEYGGWGYRMRPGKSGLMLRSGDAIVIRRTDGREFAVTVDDAETAAALLNTLARRERASG
ncbi:DUF1648 domain-containing protein [Streptomyces sp. NPDC006691]|uniref:DUF1648 domain-containing protein n=1 Tax=Streptomyces sp. NPDC006691 TaxID=3364757 RepID=UPI0036C69468